jgi:hypothetical protein
MSKNQFQRYANELNEIHCRVKNLTLIANEKKGDYFYLLATHLGLNLISPKSYDFPPTIAEIDKAFASHSPRKIADIVEKVICTTFRYLDDRGAKANTAMELLDDVIKIPFFQARAHRKINFFNDESCFESFLSLRQAMIEANFEKQAEHAANNSQPAITCR